MKWDYIFLSIKILSSKNGVTSVYGTKFGDDLRECGREGKNVPSSLITYQTFAYQIQASATQTTEGRLTVSRSVKKDSSSVVKYVFLLKNQLS